MVIPTCALAMAALQACSFTSADSGLTCTRLRAVALSPEGVPTDATCALAEPGVSPPGPDVIVNINADSTAAFSAWAMGSAGGGALDAVAAGGAAVKTELGVDPATRWLLTNTDR